jgi:hypothetical protein
MSGYEDAFGDAVYDAWMAGLDPDAVDRESVADFYREYGNRWDAAEAEVNRIAREDHRKEPEHD